MLNFLESLVEMDNLFRQILLDYRPEAKQEGEVGFKQLIIGLLEEAARDPGRASKLRVMYLLERLSEVSQDLRDSGEHEYYAKHSDMM